MPYPKAGKPGEFRTLGIPTIYDRVCQQALLNRLEPIFEPVFDDANFGYRRGRSTKDTLRKVWTEIKSGREWIVDAGWKDFFDTIPHRERMQSVARRIVDREVLRLIKAWLKVPVEERDEKGNRRMTGGKGSRRGTPQGGVVSPPLANLYLNRF